MSDATKPIDDPIVFRQRQQELARDSIIRAKQIEVLIDHLPGIGQSESDQMEKLRELELELRHVNAESIQVDDEKQALERQVNTAIQTLAHAKMKAV